MQNLGLSVIHRVKGAHVEGRLLNGCHGVCVEVGRMGDYRVGNERGVKDHRGYFLFCPQISNRVIEIRHTVIKISFLTDKMWISALASNMWPRWPFSRLPLS